MIGFCMKKAPISHGNYPDLPLDDLKNIYLDRYAWPGPQIKSTPKTGTKIIVVIPCFSEPDILESLQSLHDCENPGCSVEVIIVVNHGEHVHEKIKNLMRNQCYVETQACSLVVAPAWNRAPFLGRVWGLGQ